MSSMMRSLARNRAKENMRELGFKQFCKHGYSQNSIGKAVFIIRLESEFAEKWRKFANGTVSKKKRGVKKHEVNS